jgi:bacterioferritin
MNEFGADVKMLRERARHNMLNGAVTENYTANRDQVIQVLNDVLATEIVCTLLYMRQYYMATGINAEAVKREFQQHAQGSATRRLGSDSHCAA